jgi:hypothetical protein
VLSTTVDDSQTSGTYRGLHLYILMISGGYFYDVRIDLVTLVLFGPVSQGIRIYIVGRNILQEIMRNGATDKIQTFVHKRQPRPLMPI